MTKEKKVNRLNGVCLLSNQSNAKAASVVCNAQASSRHSSWNVKQLDYFCFRFVLRISSNCFERGLTDNACTTLITTILLCGQTISISCRFDRQVLVIISSENRHDCNTLTESIAIDATDYILIRIIGLHTEQLDCPRGPCCRTKIVVIDKSHRNLDTRWHHRSTRSSSSQSMRCRALFVSLFWPPSENCIHDWIAIPTPPTPPTQPTPPTPPTPYLTPIQMAMSTQIHLVLVLMLITTAFRVFVLLPFHDMPHG